MSTLLFGLIVPIEVNDVKAAIREILQHVLDHPEMATKAAVDSYFDQFLFSLEKIEWGLLTDDEKQQFAVQLALQNGSSPNGAGLEITNLRVNRLVTFRKVASIYLCTPSIGFSFR